MAPSSSVEVPQEIITEILTHLPPKPLNRFKCVSQKWKTLITSRRFTNLHLKQALISNPNRNLIVSNTTLKTALRDDNQLRFTEINHPLKQLPHRPAVELIESCHGLLLISDYHKHSVYLYNPSILNHHRLLPKAPSRAPKITLFDPNPPLEVFGFGYDALTDDYKVVRMLQWHGDDVGSCRETSVYSLQNNSWDYVTDHTALYYLQSTNAVFSKQVLHFMAVSRDFKPVLKCFDLRSNTISLVEFPELDSYDFSKITMSLRALQGCLCLLVNYQKKLVESGVGAGDPLYNRKLLYADVWEMREGGKKESWVKLFRVRKREIVGHCMYLRLVTYSKDKRRVLIEFDGTWFGWYDLVTKQVKKVLLQGLGVEDAPHMAFTFVESLVSVKNEKVVPKGGTMPRKTIKKNDFLTSGFKLKL